MEVTIYKMHFIYYPGTKAYQGKYEPPHDGVFSDICLLDFDGILIPAIMWLKEDVPTGIVEVSFDENFPSREKESALEVLGSSGLEVRD